MTYSYKFLPKDEEGNEAQCILRKEDGAFIPFNEENIDYQAYLAWVAEGNTAEAADQTVYKLTTQT